MRTAKGWRDFLAKRGDMQFSRMIVIELVEGLAVAEARIAEVEGERDDNEVSASIYRDRAERAEAERDLANSEFVAVEKRLAEVVKAAGRIACPYLNEIPGMDFEVDSVDMGYLREALTHAHEEEGV